jgi:uracil-DNA glycosylase
LQSSPNELHARYRLFSAVNECEACPRMCHSRRVLTDLNGSWVAKIMFVAEAPGRLGAEKTGVPLFGDRTGDRFDELLSAMALKRSEVFITNAALCNPRDDRGNNAQPTTTEIMNCSVHLGRTIDLVNPTIVISLGRVALSALALISEHRLELRNAVGRLYPWYQRTLGVLYHPGPRSAVHRPWDAQVRDARRLIRAGSSFF